MGSHSYLHLTLCSLLFYRPTRQTGGWALSCAVPQQEACGAGGEGPHGGERMPRYHPTVLPLGTHLHPLFGPCSSLLAPPHEGHQPAEGDIWPYSHLASRWAIGWGCRWSWQISSLAAARQGGRGAAADVCTLYLPCLPFHYQIMLITIITLLWNAHILFLHCCKPRAVSCLRCATFL